MAIDSTLVRLFCENLRRLRKEKCITQADLAKRLDMSQPAYARLENGGCAPTLTTIEKIALSLGVDAGDLLRTTKAATTVA